MKKLFRFRAGNIIDYEMNTKAIGFRSLNSANDREKKKNCKYLLLLLG